MCIERQQTKIFQIVTIARRINSNKFDYNVFNNLPKKIESKDDFDLFWVQFKIIQNNFKKSKIPFFQSTTTLLHLLMEMGFYCVKPDVIVMKIASEIGIVNKEMNNKNFIEVVKILQEYSINKNIKPSIIDLCFLIKGNQKSTTKFFKTI